MRRVGMYLEKRLLLLLSLAALLSCTVAPPQVLDSRVEMQLVDDRDLGRVYPQLSVFLLAEDGDGVGDLELLYVIHDESRLYWRFRSDSWQRIEYGGNTWVGFSGLTMADYGSFPAGQYRLLIIDRAGERDETTVRVGGVLPEPAELREAFPQLESDGEGVRLVTEDPVLLRLTDERGREVRSLEAQAGEYRWQDLAGAGVDPGGLSLHLELPPRASAGAVPGSSRDTLRFLAGPYRQ